MFDGGGIFSLSKSQSHRKKSWYMLPDSIVTEIYKGIEKHSFVFTAAVTSILQSMVKKIFARSEEEVL